MHLSKQTSTIGITVIRFFTGWFIFRYSLELFHIEGLLDFLRKEQFPLPVFMGYSAKIIEFIGGICLVLGLFTRWVTPALIIVMAGVIYVTAHGSILEGEFPFLFALLFGVFFFNGAGEWSLDHLLEKRREKKQLEKKVI